MHWEASVTWGTSGDHAYRLRAAQSANGASRARPECERQSRCWIDSSADVVSVLARRSRMEVPCDKASRGHIPSRSNVYAMIALGLATGCLVAAIPPAAQFPHPIARVTPGSEPAAWKLGANL